MKIHCKLLQITPKLANEILIYVEMFIMLNIGTVTL